MTAGDAAATSSSMGMNEFRPRVTHAIYQIQHPPRARSTKVFAIDCTKSCHPPVNRLHSIENKTT
jgi:hypothetical protein